MARTVDISAIFGLLPIGPLRDKRTVDISTADFEDEGGFVCQAVKAGSLTYRTVGGDADQSETLQAGETVQLGGHMVALKAVRASSAVGSIVIGRL